MVHRALRPLARLSPAPGLALPSRRRLPAFVARVRVGAPSGASAVAAAVPGVGLARSLSRVERSLPRPAFAVALAVGSAQAADAITFLRMVTDHGVRAEANPLVAALAAQGHVLGLLLAKVAVVWLVVGVVAALARHYPTAGALVATAAVVAGLIGAWSNVLAMLAMR